MSWGAFGMGALDKLLTNSSNLFGTGDKLKERERADAIEDYKTQEYEGIQARVEGAKAAGLHPLAALGYQSGPGASIPVGGTSEMRTDTSSWTRPAPGAQPQVDERYRAAQIRLLEAQADEAEARARASENALARQPGNPQPMPTDADNQIPGQGLRSGIKVVPSEITAGKGGFQAGTHQGASVVRIPLGDGRTAKLNVPGDQLSQGLEDMDAVKTLITLAMNRGAIGNFFTEDIPWAVKGWLSDLTRSNKAVADRLRDERNIRSRPRGGR